MHVMVATLERDDSLTQREGIHSLVQRQLLQISVEAAYFALQAFDNLVIKLLLRVLAVRVAQQFLRSLLIAFLGFVYVHLASILPHVSLVDVHFHRTCKALLLVLVLQLYKLLDVAEDLEEVGSAPHCAQQDEAAEGGLVVEQLC